MIYSFWNKCYIWEIKTLLYKVWVLSLYVNRGFVFKIILNKKWLIEFFIQYREDDVKASIKDNKKLLKLKNYYWFVVRNDEHHKQNNIL